MNRHFLETYQQLSQLRPEREEGNHNRRLAEIIDRAYRGTTKKEKKNSEKEGQKA